MKILLSVAILCLSGAVALAQDFREATWGSTAEEIRQTEQFEFVGNGENQGNDLLIYNGSVGNLNANTFYEVSPTLGLVAGAYIFQEQHVNQQDFISDFKRIEAILSRVYGEPEVADEMWNGDLFKDSPDDYGTAVAAGYLSYSTIWTNSTTQIQHFLDGDNYEITHLVRYTSLINVEQQEQQNQENEEEGF